MSDPQAAPAGRNGAGPQITPEHPVVVIGGGPAGLTAGYLLAKQGKSVIVLEASDQVGGIARTEVRDGYRFDLGGHRFFTKVKEVVDLLGLGEEAMPAEVEAIAVADLGLGEAADLVLGLEDDHGHALLGEQISGGEAGGAAAQHGDGSVP